MRRILLGFGLLVVLLASCNIDPFTPSPRWLIREASRTLPEELCQKGTVYRECWAETWFQCIDIARDTAREIRVEFLESPENLPRDIPGMKKAMRERAKDIFGLRIFFGLFSHDHRHPRCNDDDFWPP